MMNGESGTMRNDDEEEAPQRPLRSLTLITDK
jgi:hypothetical protein